MTGRETSGLETDPGSLLPDDEDSGLPWMTWLACACALIVLLIVYYAYPTLGMVLGTVMLALIVLRAVFYVWLTPPDGEFDSPREAFVSRLKQIRRNKAIVKIKQLSSRR